MLEEDLGLRVADPPSTSSASPNVGSSGCGPVLVTLGDREEASEKTLVER